MGVSSEMVVVRTPDAGSVPDAGVDQSGALHVVFVAGDDVRYSKSTGGGKTFSAPIQVNSEAGTAHPAELYRGPDIAVGKDGQVHVIWYSNAWQQQLPKDQWESSILIWNPGGRALLPRAT